MKNNIKILAYILAIIIAVGMFFVFIINAVFAPEQEKEYMYNGQWYSEKELKEVVPPQYINVPAKNTPEDAYTAFREALLADDVEKALGFMTEESRDEYRELFKDEDIYQKYKMIPEFKDLIENSDSDNYFEYIYFGKEKDPEKDPPYTIEFEKGLEGLWQIESL